MKNVHLIPTDKPSRLSLKSNGKYHLTNQLHPNSPNFTNQHIYITFSEEIKEGDWVITYNGLLAKVITEITWHFMNSKKIILTTDQDLIEDGVQAIPDDFIEWFVKNANESGVPFDRCEVVKEMYMPQSNGKISDGKITHELSLNESLNTLPFYKIIIPREEPKDVVLGYKTSLDAQMLNSQYVDFSNPNADKITSASTTTIKEKPKQQRVPVAVEAPKQEPTLEEVAEKYVEDFDLSFYDTVEEIPVKELGKKDFKEGAKWQADDIIDKLYIHIINNEDDWSRNPQVEFKSFVGQFKKK